MFSLVMGLKIYSKEVEGGRHMRGSDGKLCYNEKERGSLERWIRIIMLKEMQ